MSENSANELFSEVSPPGRMLVSKSKMHSQIDLFITKVISPISIIKAVLCFRFLDVGPVLRDSEKLTTGNQTPAK
jgi:hypothetical protein